MLNTHAAKTESFNGSFGAEAVNLLNSISPVS